MNNLTRKSVIQYMEQHVGETPDSFDLELWLSGSGYLDIEEIDPDTVYLSIGDGKGGFYSWEETSLENFLDLLLDVNQKKSAEIKIDEKVYSDSDPVYAGRRRGEYGFDFGPFTSDREKADEWLQHPETYGDVIEIAHFEYKLLPKARYADKLDRVVKTGEGAIPDPETWEDYVELLSCASGAMNGTDIHARLLRAAEPYSFSIGSDGQPFLFVQDC